MYLFFATVLLVFALSGLVALRFTELGKYSIFYGLLGWIGHSFALPLALFCALVLWILAYGEEPHPVSANLLTFDLVIYLYLHWRNHRAGRDMASTIAAVTGEAPITARISLLAGLLPLRRRQHGVSVIRDIAYSDGDPCNRLDIYLPENPPATLMPILIDIHGGAWISGRRSQQAIPLLYTMVNQGWMCVSMSYRLGPRHRFPAMLQDVMRAIAWVKEHAREYGGNQEFIALSGGSAGGHLTSLAALNPNREDLQPGFETQDTRVQAAVPVYGRYDAINRYDLCGSAHASIIQFMAKQVMPCSYEEDPDLWELSSPISQVREDAPPFLIVHGTHDSVIPIEEADRFAEALKSTSNNLVVYCRLKGGEHAFDILNSALTAYHVRAVAQFLNKQYALSNRPASTSGEEAEA